MDKSWISCELCNDSGYVHPMVNGKIQYGIIKPCKCSASYLSENKKTKLLQSCEFPPLVEKMEFTNFKIYFKVETAYKSAQEVAKNSGYLFWLTLLGHNGVGKTHLAIAICKAWVNQGIPARYVYVPLLLDELREGFKSDGDDSYTTKFNYYCTVPLLLMDDLGSEYSTAWVQEKLETIIDYRLMHKLSLIITCNKTLDELSPRIASRLCRLPESKVIEINAEDYMLAKKIRK